jgi:hypothetical protein
MAGTRNKYMYSEFCVDYHQVVKQKEWLANTDPCVNERPAMPIGYTNPRMPASLLAQNAVDIESNLRGIGANNYIFPKAKVTPQLVQLPTVTFYNLLPLYVPVLPEPLREQRPTRF